MKYFGTMLDRTLSFNYHVDMVILKAKKGLRAMKAVAGAVCHNVHYFC